MGYSTYQRSKVHRQHNGKLWDALSLFFWLPKNHIYHQKNKLMLLVYDCAAWSYKGLLYIRDVASLFSSCIGPEILSYNNKSKQIHTHTHILTKCKLQSIKTHLQKRVAVPRISITLKKNRFMDIYY